MVRVGILAPKLALSYLHSLAPHAEKKERRDSQVRGTALLGLVVVGAGDAEGDAVLAGSLGIVGVLACAANLARTAGVATCGAGAG